MSSGSILVIFSIVREKKIYIFHRISIKYTNCIQSLRITSSPILKSLTFKKGHTFIELKNAPLRNDSDELKILRVDPHIGILHFFFKVSPSGKRPAIATAECVCQLDVGSVPKPGV